ncbi:hypothetical protein [Streptomyces sp. NPDC060194]|uniref:hypothetical protein n=1 Tax=Streptomyces sp. NPDC060194 TaxID=3347069 RepID=UPI003650ADEB
MGDPRPYGPGENGPDAAIPRDMPDQQAGPGPDPLDVPAEGPKGDRTEDDAGDDAEPADVPDTDESGTGPRRDAASQGGVNPEQPPPDEPAD